VETRDLRGLFDMLAPDVVWVSDGGGLRQASLRPVVGADKVARLIAGILGKVDGVVTARPAMLNGAPALITHVDGELDGVVAMRVENGRITGIYYVRNPEKLTRVDRQTPLTLR